MSKAFRTLSPKLHKAVAQSAYLPRALRLVWTAAGRWTTFWAALLVAQGLLPVATVCLTRSLVNGLVAAIRTTGSWRPVLLLAAAMGAVARLMACSFAPFYNPAGRTSVWRFSSR